jgi:hypothetical protein
MKVFIANAITDSGDQYNFTFSSEPTKEFIVNEVRELEGEIEDLEWYMETTRVAIFETEIEDKNT